MFFVAGEELTRNVRVQLFTEIVYKNISWFDDKTRAPGILSMVFSEDILNLNGLTTELVGTICECFFTLCIGIWVSAIFQWRMTLVSVAAMPLTVIGGIL